MIDGKAVENIRTHGVYRGSGAGRSKVLFEDLGLRADQEADYVILTGCVQPEGMPHVFSALGNLLARLRVDYTFLSREFCCGWLPLGQPAVMAKNEEDIARSKVLAEGFIQENFRQAKTLRAKSVVLFCAACEPNYSNYKSSADFEVISYTELLDRCFEGGDLQLDADYYAGCYRFRRRITSISLDLEPAVRILDRVAGLKVNHLDNSQCCYIPPHLENLIQDIKTNTVITICTGCYYNLQRTLKHRGDYQVKMLPEVVWESIQV